MKKINWQKRFRNKAWLLAFISVIITAVYGVLNSFGITPKIAQNDLTQYIITLLNFLSMMGVIVDGTTPGVKDSAVGLSELTAEEIYGDKDK